MASSDKIAKVKAAIQKIEAVIGDTTIPQDIRDIQKTALANAKKELAKLEEAGEGDDKPAAKKTKSVKPKKAKPAKAAKSAKKGEAKKDDPEAEEWQEIIGPGGVKKMMNIADCEQAMEAFELRKMRDAETSAKSKTRTPSVKAKGHVQHAINNIADMVPDKNIAQSPAKVIASFEKFEHHMKEAFNALKGAGISDANIARLKSALDTVDDAIKAIKEEAETKKK